MCPFLPFFFVTWISFSNNLKEVWNYLLCFISLHSVDLAGKELMTCDVVYHTKIYLSCCIFYSTVKASRSYQPVGSRLLGNEWTCCEMSSMITSERGPKQIGSSGSYPFISDFKNKTSLVFYLFSSLVIKKEL